MRRSVITGIGLVSPLGSSLDSFWDTARNGRSGLGPITSFDATGYGSRIAGEVQGFDPDVYIPPKERRRMDQYSQYAIGAAAMAVEDAGLDMDVETPERVGVLVGSGVGGIQVLHSQSQVLVEKGPSRSSPFMIPMMICNMAGGLIAIRFNMKGPNHAVVSACASAAHSMGDAIRIIERGDADVMLAGGAEACVCELAVAGFSAMKALSTRNDEPRRASRPFDLDRDGFVVGEGSGVFVIEEIEHARKRGATIYCEVAGFGMTCDAYHMTAPAETGEGAARAMTLAMQDAGVNPGDVDYINAHGTSTPLNDKMETQAIKTALGADAVRTVQISSTKSMSGHLLGAAAAIESAVCAMAIRDQVIPPTVNYETPDPECDLDYVPNTARESKVRTCLNNSFGFGGHNACLVLRAVD